MTQTDPPLPLIPSPGQDLPPLYPAPQTNGLAIASLVLGIVSLACSVHIAAIPGVLFGHIALKEIRNSRGTQAGQGMAIAGLVTGYIALGMLAIALTAGIAFILLGFLGMAVSA